MVWRSVTGLMGVFAVAADAAGAARRRLLLRSGLAGTAGSHRTSSRTAWVYSPRERRCTFGYGRAGQLAHHSADDVSGHTKYSDNRACRGKPGHLSIAAASLPAASSL